MHKKHIPMRKCSGCGEIKSKGELIRVVKSKDKENGINENIQISLDLTGKKPGRGAYLCKNIDCLKLARKLRRLERSFSCKIPPEVYDRLEEELLGTK